MQMKKFLYQDVDYYVISVLIELFNNEPYLPKDKPIQESDEWIHSDSALAKDYQTFDDQVPDNLFHIKIPSIDTTEVAFKTHIDSNREICVSGGFGDIFQARLSTTGKEVIVKIVKNMTFEDILRETRIQTYLLTSVCVPKLLGIIGGPDRPVGHKR